MVETTAVIRQRHDQQAARPQRFFAAPKKTDRIGEMLEIVRADDVVELAEQAFCRDQRFDFGRAADEVDFVDIGKPCFVDRRIEFAALDQLLLGHHIEAIAVVAFAPRRQRRKPRGNFKTPLALGYRAQELVPAVHGVFETVSQRLDLVQADRTLGHRPLEWQILAPALSPRCHP